MKKTMDELKIVRMRNIRNHHARRIEDSWRRIRESVLTPEKPEGLDRFLQEMGVGDA